MSLVESPPLAPPPLRLQPVVRWHIPKVFEPMFRPKRNKIFYGGRGSAKSVSAATAIAALLYMRQPILGQPFRVLCGREYQNSISDSVHFEIVSAVWRLGLTPYFKITGNSVMCRTTGAHVIYRGLHNNINSIKSLGGIDLFWGEEAHSFTEDSLIYIEPTIRRDPPFGPFGTGSELWYTMNQTLDTDPIYVKFKLDQAPWEDDTTIVVPSTWKDNYVEFVDPGGMDRALAAYPERELYPIERFVQEDGFVKVVTFPGVLQELREKSEKLDPKDHYEWVWGTQCRNIGGIFFALEHLLVNGQPIENPKLCDGVYAIIDSATKTGRENDGTAVTYFAKNTGGAGIPLMILDWDVTQISGDLLITWLPSVHLRGKELAEQCKARMGWLGVFIEDKASGMILLQQAKRRNLQAEPIESKLTAMGKVERAINASPYVARGMVKFTKPAYDKVAIYKGVSRNHLLAQVTSFRVGDTETDDDDLLDCFTYGVAIGVGNAEGF